MQKVRSSARAAPFISLEQFKAETEKRAREIYLKRQEKNEQGDALSDWLKAEKEIKAKYRIA